MTPYKGNPQKSTADASSKDLHSDHSARQFASTVKLQNASSKLLEHQPSSAGLKGFRRSSKQLISKQKANPRTLIVPLLLMITY